MYENKTALEHCRYADFMACDHAQLVDLQDVHIDSSRPLSERMDAFVQQVRNPYLFKVDGLVIKATYLPHVSRRLTDAIPGLLIP